MKLMNSFREAAQIRQAHAFDAFRSREEEENLRAWEQVLELADNLGECDDSKTADVAGKLHDLARKRLSFADELGFSEQEMASRETASGMIAVMKGTASGPADTDFVASANGPVSAGRVASAVCFPAASLDDVELFGGDELEEAVLPSSLGMKEDAVSAAGVAAADGVAPAPVSDAAPAPDGAVSGSAAACAADAAAGNGIPNSFEASTHAVPAEMATFKHLCTGRDGKLCLFEDTHGHLVAVRASRLA